MTASLPALAVYTNDPETKFANAYNIPLARLRAFIVALVVAHHAVLAYFPWLPPPNSSLLAQPRLWQAFPTLDPQRWSGWAFFAGFNDTFFMALMFFLSGVFVWGSLQRKGTGRFLRDRFVRLGLPFVAAAAVLAPLAYFPAYLQTTATPTFAAFWLQWRSLETWPAGPAWFLWVLLGFGCAAAALFKLIPQSAVSINKAASPILNRPVVCFLILALLSSSAYVPMTMAFGPFGWTAWGPFAFQTSRIIHYAFYFAAGAIVGAGTAGPTILAPTGPLAKRWILWPATASVLFAANTAISAVAAGNPAHSSSLHIAGDFAYTITCAAICMACLSVFLRFARSRGALLDNFCACAFGIYLIHYPVVNWLQHALLSFRFSGFLKGATVALGGLVLSWLVMLILRRLAIIARTI
ncbi:MAG: acyltransferase family protein [Limisphaerales bacterium]